MPRITIFILIFFWIIRISAQDEVRLPADLRQHNLTTYNSSLFNPVFSLDRNDPQSLAFATRWQWQDIDTDPTTLYLNYTRRLKERSTAGAAFFQHNTGIFFNTGGVLNYAHQFQFSHSVRLSVGFNLFGFVQELADTRFQIDPQLPVPLPGTTNDFILQLAPGASLSVERLTLSLASENVLDYNFRAKEANTPASDKIFMGMMSYDFPVSLGANKALLRPALYMRTIPEQENQIGILSLLRTEKYWGQLGYNNFYGVGVGIGGTFFKRFNLGAVFEFGTSASINSKDPSFEIVAAYFLGNPNERSVVAMYEDEQVDQALVSEEPLDDEKIEEELKKAEELANEVKTETQETEEVGEPEEPQVTEEISKKELRKAEREAAAEEKRLAKEQTELAKEEEERLEEEAKEAEKAEKEQEKIRIAAEKAAEREAELKKEVETREATERREAAERAEAARVATQQRQDSIAEAQKAIQEAAQQAATKRRLDSLNEARKAKAEAEAQALDVPRRQDSIAQAQAAVAEAEKEEVQPEEGEKYEEVTTEDGLEPGFYLITNVFGTKKYFDAFMADLTSRGLEPKSFLRSLNNYNYVYLQRYDTMAQARRARDSQFNGRYTEKTWVFRVVGN
ncbi:MAG: PorP/SprF family type IX secretion system membrane protein [Aurantibacter sp.]